MKDTISTKPSNRQCRLLTLFPILYLTTLKLNPGLLWTCVIWGGLDSAMLGLALQQGLLASSSSIRSHSLQFRKFHLFVRIGDLA